MYLKIASILFLLLACKAPSDDKSAVRDLMNEALVPAAAGPKLFETEEPLKITLKAPLSQLNNDPGFTEGATRDGVLIQTDGRELAVKVTIRGQTSIGVCKFRKMEIEFLDSNAVGDTVFKGQKSFDLGTHCAKLADSIDTVRLGDARAVGREQAIYAMLAQLTEVTRRARFLDVTYIDSDTGNSEVQPAFALEELKSVRKRLNAEKVDAPVTYDQLDQKTVATAFMFNILVNNADLQIGNLTFGGVKENLTLHNAKLIKVGNSLLTVPYDFDIAGAVTGFSSDEFVADLNKKFLPNASSIWRQMAYRFYLMRQSFTAETLSEVVSLFKDKEALLRQTVLQSHADAAGKILLKGYLDTFYQALSADNLNLPMLKKAGVPVYKDKGRTVKLCSKMPGGYGIVVRQKSGNMLKVQLVASLYSDRPGCEGIPDFDEIPVTKALWVDLESVDGNAAVIP